MDLSNLRPAEGSKHSDNFRRGRGHGSGNGKTAGKGHKGQKARSGAPRIGFEGGQMPLYRRVARRGFSNCPFKVTYQAISLKDLEVSYEAGEVVNDESLRSKGLIKGNGTIAKILSNGELTKALTVDGIKCSASAAERIKAAGGEVK